MRDSRAFYGIAVELHTSELIETATQRGEQALASMLSTAKDGHICDPHVVAQTLLAAVNGTVRAFYERDLPPAIGGEVERHLTTMGRSYLCRSEENGQAGGIVSALAG